MTDAPPKTHNSDPKQQLKVTADRIVRLTEEMKAIREDIADIYSEAKSAGFHVPALRDAVKYAMLDGEGRKKLDERTDQRDVYVVAIT